MENEDNNINTTNSENTGNTTLNNSKNNYIKINNFNKINPNIKYNKKNKINNIKTQNNRRNNKVNFIKRDIYYIPQKDFSRSLIKNSETVKKITSKENLNFCSQISKNNRNVSIIVP